MTENKSSLRLEWLDVAKGIVIMLMVLGHTGLPIRASNIIFAFHMPFFFLASGFTTKFDKYSVWRFTINKFKTIGIPFVIYSVINLALQPLAYPVTHKEYLLNFLKEGWGGVPLWFIPVFLVSLLLARLVFLIQNKRVRYIVTVLLPIISAILCYLKIQLPWTLAVVPFATFFVLLGDYCKPYLTVLSSISTPKAYWFIIALITFLGISQLWRLDMAWNNVLPLIPKIVGAVCGCYCIIKISAFISEKVPALSRILQEIGKETYIILAFAEIFIVLVNYYWGIGIIEKYLLLTLTLAVVAMIKNIIKGLFRNKSQA